MRGRLLRNTLIAASLLSPALSSVAGTVQRSLCVFDIIGSNGDVYQMMKDYAVAARKWGVDFELRPYTDESTAKADFQAGECDAVVITGIRNRGIVKFAGSLDMMAATPSYEAQRTAIVAISSPGAARYMREGPYETAGVVNMGKVYLFARDDDWLDSWKNLAGKKVATISYDDQARQMVQHVGATVVPASISTFAAMFNNGNVDVAYAPAYAFTALELYKGLGDGGGILDYNLGILSAQIDIRHERFPEDFGVKSRQWVAGHLWDDAMRVIEKSEAQIPDDYWYEPEAGETREYNRMFADVRQTLYENNVYSRKMQYMLKKIRCRENPGNPECTRDTEGGPAGG
ncbi:RND transporter [Ectothiorhodospiraceae bacterium WFHF3C12]|nr:RND transporter [Ectothiorhodospiraceae bacterium WFHF3C12]